MSNDEGGYLLPKGAAQAFQWMKENDIVKVTMEVKFDTKTWKKISETFHFYKSNGTEWKETENEK